MTSPHDRRLISRTTHYAASATSIRCLHNVDSLFAYSRKMTRLRRNPSVADYDPCASLFIGWPCLYMRGGLSPADWPPSIGITDPVMNADASEQSHSTAEATSSTVPTRRIGVDCAAMRCASPPAAS